MFYCKEIEFTAATDAWEKAKNCSLFCSPTLLKNFGYKARYFGGYKNNNLLIVWPLIESKSGLSKVPLFSYFFGPFWVDTELYGAPYKMFKNNLEVLNSMFPVVDKVASKVSFSLVPEFPDLRPFMWWNYHNPVGSKFDIKLRYTGRIEFINRLSEDELINQFRADDKRKKIKKAIRSGCLATRWGISIQPHEYLNLYLATLKRTGGSSNDETNQALIKMIDLVNGNCISSANFKIIELVDVVKNTVEGFQLVLIGKEMIYLIAQSVTAEAMGKNGNLLLTFEAIKYANINRLNLDFNGANSPTRAEDKHAFGACIKSYYDIELVNQ
jgi:hypothetical protein